MLTDQISMMLVVSNPSLRQAAPLFHKKPLAVGWGLIESTWIQPPNSNLRKSNPEPTTRFPADKYSSKDKLAICPVGWLRKAITFGSARFASFSFY